MSIEPITVESKYQFASYRYKNYNVHVQLLPINRKNIADILRFKFPIGSPGQDAIKQYVQDNSCGYCLQYGHISNPNNFPSECPNVGYDYYEWISKLSKKYDIKENILNYYAMTGLDIIPEKQISSSECKVRLFGAPYTSKYQFEKALNNMICDNCNANFHTIESCPQNDCLSQYAKKYNVKMAKSKL